MKWFNRKPRGFPTWGDEVVWRSTGVFGDFQMYVALKVAPEHPLSDKDVLTILRRYHAHVAFWNFTQDTIRHELEMFARVAGVKPIDVITTFNELTNTKAAGRDLSTVELHHWIDISCGGHHCGRCMDCILSKLDQVEL